MERVSGWRGRESGGGRVREWSHGITNQGTAAQSYNRNNRGAYTDHCVQGACMTKLCTAYMYVLGRADVTQCCYWSHNAAMVAVVTQC